MRINILSRFICLFLVSAVIPAISFAAITVTAASGGTCLNVSPGAYTTLGALTITEGVRGDWVNSQTGATLVFTIDPTEFEFDVTAALNTTGSTFSDLSSVSAVVTNASTITVTFTVDAGATNPQDIIIINGIKIRAKVANVTGQMLRTAGTAVSNGNTYTAGDGKVHAYLAATGASIPTIGAGNWSAAGTWTDGIVPSTCHVASIGHAITVDAAQSVLGLTITSTGDLTATNAVTISGSGTFTINAGGTYRHANTGVASTTIFAGAESFSSTSNFIVTSWSNTAVALPTGCSSDFGNITFSQGGTWDQLGLFSPNKIKGNVTVTSGTITFDGGTGATTSLTIDGSVTTSGSGAVVFQRGANRNLTLVTGAFTHGSTGNTSVVLYQSYGTLDWTINGSFSASEDFTAIQGPTSGAAAAANTTMKIYGDMTISGGLFDLHRYINGNVSIYVDTVAAASGDITISGAPDWVKFIDEDCSGALSVTARSLTISGGGANSLDCGTSGNASYYFSGNVSVGTGTWTAFLGGLQGVIGAQVVNTAVSTGNLTINIKGDYTHTGGTVEALGVNGAIAGTTSFYANNFTFSGGTFYAHNGCHMGSALNTFRIANDANISFAATTDGVILINNLASGSDINTVRQNLYIGNNMTLSGITTGGTFRGSASSGAQTVTIGNTLTISGGLDSRFCSGNGHALTFSAGAVSCTAGNLWLSYQPGTVTGTITNNLTISGGTFSIKNKLGASTLTVGGNFSQTAGTFGLYDDDAAVAMTDVVAVTINGTFSHTGGTINYDDNTSSTAIHTITVNGPSFTVGGAAATYITRSAGEGTASVFGELYFNRAGTVTYERATANHRILQTKMFINSGCTVDASATSQNFQIASNSTANNIANTATKYALNISGILNIGDKLISGVSRVSTNDYYSGVLVLSGGRLRTSNLVGFWDGTTSATLQPKVYTSSTTFRMDFNLDANSIIEYYGSGNQVVTGKYPNSLGANATISDVVSTTSAKYHYGILNINNQGTLGTNYAYPAASNVFVRTRLDLTRGEFNLAGSGTGYILTIEQSAATGIARDGATTNGYIKSEETNAGNNRAKVQWNMGTSTTAHVFPFGVTTGAANYIPFSFTPTVTPGATGTVTVSTRATGQDNTPRAAASNVAACSHLYDPTLATDGGNSAVIDRWWDITATGYTADLTFTYRGAENTLMTTPTNYQTGQLGAQHWNGTGWDDVVCSSCNVGVTSGTGTVSVAGANTFSPWVLVAKNAPLPIEMGVFTARLKKDIVELEWETKSENNNDYFIIEKSTDGVNFTSISTLDGAGTSSKTNRYRAVDQNPNPGLNYYQIVQTDFDGQRSKSEIRSVNYHLENNYYIFPNPSTDKITIKSVDNFSERVNMILTDLSGRILVDEKTKLDSEKEIKIVDFPKGIYYLSIISDEGIKTYKIIKQ